MQNLSVQQGFEKITAPFTGVMTTRFLDAGALIASGSRRRRRASYTASQMDILRIFIYVPQAYVANVQTGQDVDVTLPEYPQKVFKGKVTRTADALDPTARTERVEIQLPSEQGQLLPGMYLTVRFKVQQAEPALIVPANTLDIRREGPRVAVIDGEQKAHYRDVKLGRDFGNDHRDRQRPARQRIPRHQSDDRPDRRGQGGRCPRRQEGTVRDGRVLPINGAQRTRAARLQEHGRARRSQSRVPGSRLAR